MAKLRDADGAIVIDSIEAQADIDNLKNAQASLEKAKENLLKEKNKLDAVWEGTAQSAFSNKYNIIIKDIDESLEAIRGSIKAITDTVEHYKNVEKALVAAMRRDAQ